MFKKITQKDGFSLVELLIYIAIFGAISGIAVGILTTVTKTQIQESALTDISGQIGFVTQTIQRLVTDSSLVDMTAGTASSSLTLRMPDLANDPTLIYLSGSQVYVQEGTNSAQSITSSSVTVDSLQFKKISQAPGKDTVQIDIAISAIQQAAGRTITRALRTAVARVNAAEFDSDLLPNVNNFRDIGATTAGWKSGYFSQGVTMATVSGNVGIGTTEPLALLDAHGTIALSAGETDATYISKIDHSATSPYRIMTLTSLAGTGTWRGAINFDTNYNAGSTFTAMTIRANTNGTTANVGIGTTAPTAVLNLKAGTATANTAPLKFTSGPLLGTAEAGAMEFLTDAFYLTKTTGPTREQIATAPNTLTFTNKRNTPRIYTTTSIAGTPGVLTPEINTYDYFEITAQAAALNIANPSASTPTGGEKMIIAITSDSSARALTYGTAYVAKGGVALPTTTVASKTTTLGFVYNAGLAKWNLLAVAQE